MSDRGPFGDLRDRLSSFRTRLRLFFVLIVIVPMLAVTLIVFRLIAESEQGQADARVAARQEAAISLYYDARARADRLAASIGRDRELAMALRSGDTAAIKRRRRAPARRDAAPSGSLLARGRPRPGRRGRPAAPRSPRPARWSPTAGRSPTCRSRCSTPRPTRGWCSGSRAWRRSSVAATRSWRRRSRRRAACSLPPGGPRGQGRRSAARSTAPRRSARPGSAAGASRCRCSSRSRAPTSDIRRGRLRRGPRAARLLPAGARLGDRPVALARPPDRGVPGRRAAPGRRRLLRARARRAGATSSPQLGDEFNKMSEQLDHRLQELAQERLRLELSLRRIGETFASNLDRDGLLEIMVRTAVDAVDATGGHAADAARRRRRAGRRWPAPATTAARRPRRWRPSDAPWRSASRRSPTATAATRWPIRCAPAPPRAPTPTPSPA